MKRRLPLTLLALTVAVVVQSPTQAAATTNAPAAGGASSGATAGAPAGSSAAPTASATSPAKGAATGTTTQPTAQQKVEAERIKAEIESKAKAAVKAEKISGGGPSRTTMAAGANPAKFSIRVLKEHLPKAKSFANACSAANEALAGSQEALANVIFWDGSRQTQLRNEARYWRDEARKWRENYGAIERTVNALVVGYYYTITLVWGNGPADRYSVTGQAAP